MRAELKRAPLYKQTKEQVDYTDHAMVRSERCALCRHFRPLGSCAIVAGWISPGGWCRRFERDK
jgi:hypothetical protein